MYSLFNNAVSIDTSSTDNHICMMRVKVPHKEPGKCQEGISHC